MGLIALALAGLAGLAIAGFALRPPPIDAETLCRTDRALAAHTFILVDSTDRLEPRHRRRLRAVVAQERTRLKPYERLSIAAVRPDRPQEPRLLFSLCNPGDGRDANPLFQNTKRAQERFDETFGTELDRAVRRASGGRAARASPITASIRAVAADPEFGPSIRARRFVLISDLLEHDPVGFTLYVSQTDYGRFRAAGARAPDLNGVAVRIAVLDRPDHADRQTYARERFWPNYFDESDASSVTFDAAP
jgi:hypothetical protein